MVFNVLKQVYDSPPKSPMEVFRQEWYAGGLHSSYFKLSMTWQALVSIELEKVRITFVWMLNFIGVLLCASSFNSSCG